MRFVSIHYDLSDGSERILRVNLKGLQLAIFKPARSVRVDGRATDFPPSLELIFEGHKENIPGDHAARVWEEIEPLLRESDAAKQSLPPEG
jgi:hypothetical protein